MVVGAVKRIFICCGLLDLLLDPLVVGGNADETFGQQATAFAKDLSTETNKYALIDGRTANIASADAFTTSMAQAKNLIVVNDRIVDQAALTLSLHNGGTDLQGAVHIGLRLLGASPARDVDVGARGWILGGQWQGAHIFVEDQRLGQTEQGNTCLQLIVVRVNGDLLHANALSTGVQIHGAGGNHKHLCWPTVRIAKRRTFFIFLEIYIVCLLLNCLSLIRYIGKLRFIPEEFKTQLE